uniref:ATP synthase subunit 8 n=1 Tax=Amblyomma cajennense TaxID=34607 RepID=L7PCT7_AMBCJ|nr:ATP synthase subunit 8 [Amblyomma cajennense]AFU55267.1 ATP synthase subunit 8 [Amblyomma cajennense]
MPQLYPMSWTMLTSFMLAFFIILMTIIFFFKPKYSMLFNKNKNSTYFFQFKW